MEVYKVRTFDSRSETFSTVLMDLKSIVSNPFGLHMIDIGVVLLNEYRKQMGLEPVDASQVAPETA